MLLSPVGCQLTLYAQTSARTVEDTYAVCTLCGSRFAGEIQRWMASSEMVSDLALVPLVQNRW